MKTAAMTRAPKFKPARDRHVSVLAVACPTCRAKAGAHCTRLDGTVPTTPLRHDSRRRMAVRADNAARGI